MATVKGMAHWAHLVKPNTKFEPVYSIDVVVDKEQAEVLELAGLNVKEDDRGLVCVFKRKLNKKKGGTNPPPAVVDAKMNPYTGNVGNGSLVQVQYRAYDWTFGNKKGTSADLIAVQVLELNEYADDKIVFEEEDGFEAEAVLDNAFDDDLPLEAQD